MTYATASATTIATIQAPVVPKYSSPSSTSSPTSEVILGLPCLSTTAECRNALCNGGLPVIFRFSSPDTQMVGTMMGFLEAGLNSQ